MLNVFNRRAPKEQRQKSAVNKGKTKDMSILSSVRDTDGDWLQVMVKALCSFLWPAPLRSPTSAHASGPWLMLLTVVPWSQLSSTDPKGTTMTAPMASSPCHPHFWPETRVITATMNGTGQRRVSLQQSVCEHCHYEFTCWSGLFRPT